MKEEQEVLVTHGYGITKLGPDLRIIATSDGHIQGTCWAKLIVSFPRAIWKDKSTTRFYLEYFLSWWQKWRLQLTTPNYTSLWHSGVQHNTKEIYGVQFHPEVDLTIHGREIMRNFCYKICGIAISDVMKNRQVRILSFLLCLYLKRNVLILIDVFILEKRSWTNQ